MPKQFPEMKFPETLYVTMEDDGDGEMFPVSAADPGQLLNVTGEAVMAAEYRLVRAGVVIETKVTVR